LNEFYESEKVIQSHEVDFMNRLRIDSLFILLQDTAAAHADKLNLGYTALKEHNFAWVLSWAKVEIEEFPCFAEEIMIKTWPKRKYKLYSLRDFRIFNKTGQIIGKATTAWLPINLKSKRIIDTSSLPAPINYQENQSAIDLLPGKIKAPAEKEFLFTEHMRYTAIDLNQHVNNIKYIELIMDSFSREHYEKYTMKCIEINFITESKYDEEIDVYKSADEENFIIEGINKKDAKTAFAANLEWKIS